MPTPPRSLTPLPWTTQSPTPPHDSIPSPTTPHDSTIRPCDPTPSPTLPDSAPLATPPHGSAHMSAPPPPASADPRPRLNSGGPGPALPSQPIGGYFRIHTQRHRSGPSRQAAPPCATPAAEAPESPRNGSLLGWNIATNSRWVDTSTISWYVNISCRASISSRMP